MEAFAARGLREVRRVERRGLGDGPAGAGVRHTFRYVVPEAPRAGAEVVLADADAHHLARVVRRGPGDAIELIDPEGRLLGGASCCAPSPT